MISLTEIAAREVGKIIEQQSDSAKKEKGVHDRVPLKQREP